MNNNCKLCGGKYDFRMIKIDECLNMTGIALSGSKRQVNNDNRFRFCPKCGRELTKENFGGVNFDDKPDMREKIREYINELDTEIKRCKKEMLKYNKYGAIGELTTNSRLRKQKRIPTTTEREFSLFVKSKIVHYCRICGSNVYSTNIYCPQCGQKFCM